MDFSSLFNDENLINPFAARTSEGEWVKGKVSVDFLNTHFGEYETAADMKKATSSEGLHKFFDWLVAEGKLDE